MRRGGLIALLLFLGVATLAPAAQADITLGSLYDGVDWGRQSCDYIGAIYYAIADLNGSPATSAPVDGTITSWSVVHMQPGSLVRLTILERGAHNDAIVAARSATQPIASAGVQTFRTELPIPAGYAIGLDLVSTPDPANSWCKYGGDQGYDSISILDDRVGVGQVAPPTCRCTGVESDERPNITATMRVGLPPPPAPPQESPPSPPTGRAVCREGRRHRGGDGPRWTIRCPAISARVLGVGSHGTVRVLVRHAGRRAGHGTLSRRRHAVVVTVSRWLHRGNYQLIVRRRGRLRRVRIAVQ